MKSSNNLPTENVKLRILKVTDIAWAGGPLDTYAIINSGPLNADSIVLPPSLYLLSQAKLGAGQNSRRAEANDLKTFFEALARSNRNWLEITDEQMSNYLKNNLQTELQLRKPSIKRHISTLKKTYRFAYTNGLTPNPLEYTYHYVEQAEVKRQGQSSSSETNLYKKYINKKIFDVISSNIRSVDGFLRERDELVLELGYNCGLRAAEVTSKLNLQTKKLRRLINEAEESHNLTITVPIIGKGNKLRHVVFNAEITQKIRNFLIGRRSKIPDGPLICSKSGNELSSGHASRVFHTALKIALPKLRWFTRRANKNNDDVYTISFNSIKKLSFHALRHTYATNLVSFCYEHGYDPWHYLMDQLGHAEETTTKIYILFDANIFHRDSIRRKLSKPRPTHSPIEEVEI